MNERQYLTGETFPQHSLPEVRYIPQTERPHFAQRREANQQESPSLLLDYWKLVRRHKWMILLLAFLGALAGLLVALPQTKVYRSQTTLEIQPYNENLLNTREVDPSASSADYYSAETNLPTQIKILQSDTLVSRVVTKLKIDRNPEVLEQPGRISVWRRAVGLPEPVAVADHDKAVGMASGSLSIRILPLTRIVAISSDSIDPQVAANFANTLANEYIEQNIEVRWKSTQRTSDWLTRQLEDVKIKLQKSEDQLQSYAYSAGLMFTGEKKDSVDEERLRQVQEELSKAQADRFAKQSQFGSTVSGQAEAQPEVFDSESLKDNQGKLTDLRRQHAELRSAFAPGHYKVKAVEAQIKELETAVAQERSNIYHRMRSEYEAALRHERLLQNAYAGQSKQVSGQAVKAVQYNILKREVDTNRSLYENLLQKVKEYGIASAMRASNIRIVDPAKVPTSPYKPDLVGNAKLGLLAGAFLGIVFAFIRDRADRTLQAPGDAPLYLNAREFGVIPSAGSERKQRIYGHRQPLLGLQIDSGNGKPANGHNANGHLSECVELVTWQQNPSRLAESFRSTLASILFSTENGNSPQVIVVTSCSPMAGKTAVTTNLGIALAEINRRVLLIDGDLRKPRLHNVFHLQDPRGLTDLLLEKDPVEDYPLESLVQRTEIPGLYVLGSGTSTHSISNLLFSTRLPQLLKRFKREFDTVLIDTPPMLNLSDARVLGRLSDGVILVFFARSTSRDAALSAVELFREDHTPVLGTILNHWNPKRNPAHDHYDNNYYYYQNDDKSKSKAKGKGA
jgi:succinoglycan biosynthesis transport protein ExoP